jgi:hypothetical protein
LDLSNEKLVLTFALKCNLYTSYTASGTAPDNDELHRALARLSSGGEEAAKRARLGTDSGSGGSGFVPVCEMVNRRGAFSRRVKNVFRVFLLFCVFSIMILSSYKMHTTVGLLHKLNPVVTHSLKAPGLVSTLAPEM